jgi:hypothetical protein
MNDLNDANLRSKAPQGSVGLNGDCVDDQLYSIDREFSDVLNDGLRVGHMGGGTVIAISVITLSGIMPSH